MLKTFTRTIGNHTYTVRQMGSKEARDLLVFCVRSFGPPFSVLLENLNADQKTKTFTMGDLDVTVVSKMIREIAETATPEQLDYLSQVLGAISMIQTESGGFVPLDLQKQSLHFCGGNVFGWFKWAGFGLEVQFSDFLAAAGLASPDVLQATS